MLTEASSPEITPEIDDEIARHLRLSSGAGVDHMEEARDAFRAAVAQLESALGLCLLPRGFVWRRRLSARSASVLAPIAPIRALNAVARVSAAGVATPLDLALFSFESGPLRPRISCRVQFFDELSFVFDAGFGEDWGSTPHDLRRAALILAAEHFDRRHGGGAPDPERAVAGLLAPWRPLRLSGGALA